VVPDSPADRSPWWASLPWQKGGARSPQPPRTSDRRSGQERRSQNAEDAERRATQRRQEQRRTHPRRLMPFGGVAPSGRLCTGEQVCVHADLVDISEGGTCVLLSAPIAVQRGDILELTLHENFGSGSIQIQLELRWVVETPMGVKLGGRFVDPAFSPAGTFLKRYLETDFSSERRSNR